MSQFQQPIEFYHQGQMRSVFPKSPQATVLNWLREEALCKGTKEGCAEGDCGACMVGVADFERGQLRLKAVNSCIQFLPQLHGKALITVEDLALDDCLHPVQKAMVDCHGAQCGFCTPGIVMSMWVDHELRRLHNLPSPSREESQQLLSGNLCRCTGYIPILNAIAEAQQQQEGDYFHPDWVHIQTLLSEVKTLAPSSIAEACAIKTSEPGAIFYAGATDVGLWATKQLRELPRLISVLGIRECQSIKDTEQGLEIGAAVSLTDAFAKLEARYPQLKNYFERFASPPIRGTGTLVGNVANGSPIGDCMPLLLALDARVRLQSTRGAREVALEDFYLSYQVKNLTHDELISHVLIPPSQGMVVAEKISKRQGQDISAIAFAGRLCIENGLVKEVRLAFGGMAGIPKRAYHTESALLAEPLNDETITEAISTLDNDFEPLNDMRASSTYRMAMAKNSIKQLLVGWVLTQQVAINTPELGQDPAYV